MDNPINKQRQQLNPYTQFQMCIQNNSYYQTVEPSGYKNMSYSQNMISPIALLQAERFMTQNLLAQLGAMTLQLKWELNARQKQTSQLKSVLQREEELLKDNQQLLAENAMLTNALKAAKDDIADLEQQLEREQKASAEKAFQLKAVLQNAHQLRADNEKLEAKNKRLTDFLKPTKGDNVVSSRNHQKSKHEYELCKVESELKQSIGRVNALTAINEMLIIGNEKRDETIAQYKKKLLKYMSPNSSSDCDSMVDNTIRSSFLSPRRLHALSSLGAENTLGPWLCLPCGINKSPLHFLSYAEFLRHWTDVHKVSLDPALC